MIRLHLQPIGRLDCRDLGDAPQQFRQHARAGRIHMLDDDEGDAAVGRDMAEELLQGLKAASGGAEGDDWKERLFAVCGCAAGCRRRFSGAVGIRLFLGHEISLAKMLSGEGPNGSGFGRCPNLAPRGRPSQWDNQGPFTARSTPCPARVGLACTSPDGITQVDSSGSGSRLKTSRTPALHSPLSAMK